MTELLDLGRAFWLNARYLRWGGKGVRWPLTHHRAMTFHRQIELVENEALNIVKVSALAKFLSERNKEYVLVVEIGPTQYWVNVYGPVKADDPGPCHRPIYDEWRGKNGTFTFLVNKGGLVSKGRRLPGVYWINQSPLMSVKRPLTRNAQAFFTTAYKEHDHVEFTDH